MFVRITRSSTCGFLAHPKTHLATGNTFAADAAASRAASFWTGMASVDFFSRCRVGSMCDRDITDCAPEAGRGMQWNADWLVGKRCCTTLLLMRWCALASADGRRTRSIPAIEKTEHSVLEGGISAWSPYG